MSVEITSVVQVGGNARYAQYDGLNGAEIVAIFGDLVSDDGTTLVYADTGFPLTTYSATVGQYVGWRSEFAEGSAIDGVDAIPSFPSLILVEREDIPTELVQRSGRGSVVAKPLGGTQDVTVTLDSPMNSAGWSPTSVDVLGPPGLAGLGGHGVTDWTVVDADTITVHVTSAIGALAGSNIIYVAAHELA